MTQPRALSPQERRHLRAVKEAMLQVHLGPDAISKKMVAIDLGRSESWYSRCVNPDEIETIPDVTDLRRWQAATGSRLPLDVLAAWWGDGFQLVEMEADQEVSSASDLLRSTAQVDSEAMAELAKDAADGKLTPEEAVRLLPLVEHREKQAHELHQVCLKAAGITATTPLRRA